MGTWMRGTKEGNSADKRRIPRTDAYSAVE